MHKIHPFYSRWRKCHIVRDARDRVHNFVVDVRCVPFSNFMINRYYNARHVSNSRGTIEDKMFYVPWHIALRVHKAARARSLVYFPDEKTAPWSTIFFFCIFTRFPLLHKEPGGRLSVILEKSFFRQETEFLTVLQGKSNAICLD